MPIMLSSEFYFALIKCFKNFKKKIAEMDEKFKKHAIYQTQLENDNQKLIYEVDLLKDLIEEHQELIIELRRQFKEKSRVGIISLFNAFSFCSFFI
jgi:hypothetical protein